jgi:oligosaccharide repeat unit polymerase
MTDAFGRTSAAVIGVAATGVGLLIALSIFPASPSPQGALVVPAIVLTAGIMFVPIVRAIRRAPTLLNAENFVALGFVFWLLLDLIQGAYQLDKAADWAIRDAFIAIGVSAAAMWFGVGGAPWRVPKWLGEIAAAPMSTRTVSRLVIVCFLLGMFNYAFATGFDLPLMFSYIGTQRWSAPWGRAQLGGWDSFLDQLQYFGYVLPSLTALLIARRGFKPMTVIAILASVIMLAFLAQGGGRRIIGVTVGAAILVWIQANPGIPVRKLVIATASAVVLLAGLQFMLNIRTLGYEEYAFRGSSEYDYLHVDDNFLRLAQVIEIIPHSHPYVYWNQILFILVRPVPRVFWPGKPVDAGIDFSAAVGQKGVSLSTSIIGEWYLTYGWFAVIFGGWLHGRFARTADTLREDQRYQANPIAYALTVMVLVSGMRSMQDLVIMSYALVAWWAANRLTRERAIATR